MKHYRQISSMTSACVQWSRASAVQTGRTLYNQSRLFLFCFLSFKAYTTPQSVKSITTQHRYILLDIALLVILVTCNQLRFCLRQLLIYCNVNYDFDSRPPQQVSCKQYDASTLYTGVTWVAYQNFEGVIYVSKSFDKFWNSDLNMEEGRKFRMFDFDW